MAIVVDRPTLPKEGVHSKFAHSFYYLLNPRDRVYNERFLRLLAMAKVRWNIGSAHKWWITTDPRKWVALPAEKRTWPRAPLVESVKRARELGIETVGQLGGFHKVGGFHAGQLNSFASRPELKDHLIISDFHACGPIDGPEAEKTIDTYVHETVKKVKDSFRYWRLDNEMNVRRFTPAELVRLHEIVYKAMKRADPRAKLWSGSLSTFAIPYTDEMLRLGYDRWVDVHDYHYYIWPQADPTYRNMGGLPLLLKVFDKYGVSVPTANGEFGCYRSIHNDGARVQAAMYARGLVVAHTYEQLQWIAPHFPTHMEYCAVSADGIFPCYLAYRTTADILEGAKPNGTLDLGDGIAAYLFKRASGNKAIVLWDPKGREASVPGVDKAWTAYDVLGRKIDTGPPNKLKLGIFPVYLTNGALEEGTKLSPL